MWNKIKEKLSKLLPVRGQRKQWFSIVAALCAVVLGLAGEVEWELVLKVVLGAFGGFVGLEGLADIVGRAKGS